MTKDEERAAAVAKRAALRMERDSIKERNAAIKEAARVKIALAIMAKPMAEKNTYVYWVLKSYTHRSGSNMEPIQLRPNGGY